MEQMKKYISISTPRKQAKSNRQAKAIFYQTLDALPKTNNPSYLWIFIIPYKKIRHSEKKKSVDSLQSKDNISHW